MCTRWVRLAPEWVPFEAVLRAKHADGPSELSFNLSVNLRDKKMAFLLSLLLSADRRLLGVACDGEPEPGASGRILYLNLWQERGRLSHAEATRLILDEIHSIWAKATRGWKPCPRDPIANFAVPFLVGSRFRILEVGPEEEPGPIGVSVGRMARVALEHPCCAAGDDGGGAVHAWAWRGSTVEYDSE